MASILQAAQTDYTNAQTALTSGNLATYQSDIAAMEAEITQAEQILGPPPPGTATATTSTTVPKTKHDDQVQNRGAPGQRATAPTGSSTTVRRPSTSPQPHLGTAAERWAAPAPSTTSRASRGRPFADGGRQSHDGDARRRAQKGQLIMGLLDKVKATAATATEAAKDAAAKGQAKLDDAQAKKAADGLLRDLGAAFYATKTGRSTPTTDSEIERLVAALQQHESEHGADHAGSRVGGGCPDGRPGGRRRVRAGTASAPASGRPGVATPAPADGPDAVGLSSFARRAALAGGGPRERVGSFLRRGVEQSGSSSGS